MNNNNNFNIGERIKELRTEKGLSQEQLALSSGITTTYLGLLERNQKNPTIKIIVQLCNVLNISIKDFFSDAQNSSPEIDTLTAKILYQIINRSDDEKKILLQIIKDTLKLRDILK